MDIVLMQEDLDRIESSLSRILEKSGAHCILLIDRSGQLISACGDKPPEDTVALAALTAANFGATAAIARMLGERDFSLLFHKGKEENIHFSSFGEDFLLVTLFNNEASLGLVRLHVEKAVRELSQIFENVFRK
jgi:predicted regulator of Ras-like GTPase activity (Roadblock/LC7/MglB family)